MNWLAHVFLSEPDLEFRLGNLLADLVKGKDRQGMPERFLHGLRCHQKIDAFTDYHPIVHRSRSRIAREFSRYSGILVDIFYDHYLARAWSQYAPMSLDEFTAELYAAIPQHGLALPEEACFALARMVADDRLGSYREVAGIRQALQLLSLRLSRRWGRPVELEAAAAALTAHDEDFRQDFAEFFPALAAHVRQAGFCLPVGGRSSEPAAQARET